MMIFAFRYGLLRKTGAPLMISNYIKANIEVLTKQDIEQIIRDIESYRQEDLISDWWDLLDWLKKYQE